MRVEQLRELFGLDASEELYGDYFCAHTKPRWGAQFLHGQLYVFSTCMVFHANLIAVVKAVRIYFKDVTVIRKRSFMRMPNTIAIERCDDAGHTDDVFTSFVFSARKRAYEMMVERWREVNPEAAEAYLQGRCWDGSDAPRCGLSTPSAHTDTEVEAPERSLLHQARPFPRPLQELVLPVGAAGGPPEGVDMKDVAGQLLTGDVQHVAHVLLSDTSGFLPHAMAQQGNQLVNITPWKVVAPNHSSLPPGALHRTFQYIYSNNGAWGTVRSIVTQQQVLRVFADGSLTLDIKQQMPELPAGVGKAFNVHIRWDMRSLHTPAPAGDAGASAARGAPDTPEQLSATAAAAAAAASTPTSQLRSQLRIAVPSISAGDGCEAAGGAEQQQQQQQQQQQPPAPHTRTAASMHNSPASTPEGAAAASASAPVTPRSLSRCQQQQQQQQQGEGAGDAEAGPHSRTPFGVMSDAPLDPPSRPGSNVGLDGSRQGTGSMTSSVDTHNHTQQQQQQQQQQGLRQQLHAASYPVALAAGHHHGSCASLCSDAGSELSYGGPGSHKAHSVPNSACNSAANGGSHGSGFIGGVIGGIKELKGGIKELGVIGGIKELGDKIKTGSSHGLNSNKRASSSNGPVGPPRAESPAASAATGSTLGSVHEDPAAESAAMGSSSSSRRTAAGAAQPMACDAGRQEGVDPRQASYSSSKGDSHADAVATGGGGGEAWGVSSCQRDQAEAKDDGGSRTPLRLIGRLTPPLSPKGAAALFGLGGGSPRSTGPPADSSAAGQEAVGAVDALGATVTIGAQVSAAQQVDQPDSRAAAAAAAAAGDDASGHQQQRPTGTAAFGANAQPAGVLTAAAAGAGPSTSLATGSDNPATHTGGACSSSSSTCVEWRVSVGVQWVKWHIAQQKVTPDTLAATSASQKQLLEQGQRWMEQPALRLSLSEVMPTAPGLRKSHRRTGSNGSVSRGASTPRNLGLISSSGGRASMQQRHTMAGAPHEGRQQQEEEEAPGGWLGRLLSLLTFCGVTTWSAGQSVVVAAGPRINFMGVVVLGASVAHVVLLWKVVVLLSALVERLDELTRVGSCGVPAGP